MRSKILLADDDAYLLRAYELSLKNDYDVISTSSINIAKQLASVNDVDVAVIDLNFEGQEEDGLALVDFILKSKPLTSIVVLSGDDDTSRVTNAMRRPIIDFVVKGNDFEDRLRIAIDRGIQKKREHLAQRSSFESKSQKMNEIVSLIERISRNDNQSPILIMGEPGTGKEHLANHIGAIMRKHVVATNMANHRPELADSALFGHMRGAFTGADSNRSGLVEQAHNGILFLDEIGETSLEVQSKLLRVVQEKEFSPVGSPTTKKVNLRFVAATNRDLHSMAKRGTFKIDLLERLSTWTFRIPPLRERPEDIPNLALQFVNAFTKSAKPFRIEPEGMQELLKYEWPGNIRELKNVIERITVACDSRVLDREAALYGIYQGRVTPEAKRSKVSSSLTREDFVAALRECNGNRTHAAKLLNIHPVTFFRKMRLMHISTEFVGVQGRPRTETDIA